jgi:DNA repair photolyase
MSVIYEPRGRAQEYSRRGLELFKGCAHQCSYCYVPGSCRMTRDQWETMKPAVRPLVLEHLSREAPRYQGTDERVLLCFLSDPYQPLEAQTRTTRGALGILAENQVPFQVLTKGGTLACADFDLYTRRDALAVTLTSVDSTWTALEPGAASNGDRIEALFEAKRRGIETWVSLEPVVDPAASLEVIRATREVVDLYKIGKINHNRALEATTEWRAFARAAVDLCEKYGVYYYIKKDLAAYCDFAFRNTDNRGAGWRENRP